MDKDKAESISETADSSVDETVAIEADTGGDADTEGHSLLTEDLAWTITRERVREGERMSRDSARVREARAGREGGLLRRFRRR